MVEFKSTLFTGSGFGVGGGVGVGVGVTEHERKDSETMLLYSRLAHGL